MLVLALAERLGLCDAAILCLKFRLDGIGPTEQVRMDFDSSFAERKFCELFVSIFFDRLSPYQDAICDFNRSVSL